MTSATVVSTHTAAEAVSLEVVVAVRIGDGTPFAMAIGIRQCQEDPPCKVRVPPVASDRVESAEIGDICRALLERGVEVPLPIPLAGDSLATPFEGGKGPHAIGFNLVLGHAERLGNALVAPSLEFREGCFKGCVRRERSLVGGYVLIVPERAGVTMGQPRRAACRGHRCRGRGRLREQGACGAEDGED